MAAFGLDACRVDILATTKAASWTIRKTGGTNFELLAGLASSRLVFSSTVAKIVQAAQKRVLSFGTLGCGVYRTKKMKNGSD